jgi:hypothetical protein
MRWGQLSSRSISNPRKGTQRNRVRIYSNEAQGKCCRSTFRLLAVNSCGIQHERCALHSGEHRKKSVAGLCGIPRGTSEIRIRDKTSKFSQRGANSPVSGAASTANSPDMCGFRANPAENPWRYRLGGGESRIRTLGTASRRVTANSPGTCAATPVTFPSDRRAGPSR